jgi:hypothetical protein
VVLEVTTKLYRVYTTHDDPEVSIHGKMVLSVYKTCSIWAPGISGRENDIRSSVDKAINVSYGKEKYN